MGHAISNSRVTSVDVSSNNVGDGGSVAIARDTKASRSLTELNPGGCSLSLADLSAICDAITPPSVLKKLSLASYDVNLATVRG